MTGHAHLLGVAQIFLDAWNTHDVRQVLARYTKDVVSRSGDDDVGVRGMDLALLESDLLCRNEVYFDRMALLPLLGA